MVLTPVKWNNGSGPRPRSRKVAVRGVEEWKETAPNE